MSGTFMAHPAAIAEPWPRYIALMAVLTFLSTVAVVLRVLDRLRRKDFGWDDWTMFGSFFLSLGFLALFVICPTVGGAGYHIETYTIPQVNNFLKILYAGNLVYNTAVCLAKASVIFFYRRIFAANRYFRIYTVVLLGALTIFLLGEDLSLTFANDPVEAQWNIEIPHTEINTAAFWLSGGIVYIIFDILIIVTPVFQVWRLKMTRERKRLITGLFLLGSAVTVATVLRVYYVTTINFNDITYDSTNTSLWAGIEIHLSIICTNIPIMYTFFREIYGQGKLRSTPETGRSSLVTFGSKPSMPRRAKHSAYEDLELTTQGTLYESYVKAGGMADTESTGPLTDSVQVQRSYEVIRVGGLR
ncbi:hypothetical protein O1611_g10415 [Lasiodiplodia mahajangana]|uniref:Uncharacterized protein n=1 Tax=Lasiodiplodia mahajangana TaxID=1108764 RepID=A0ACC2IYE7_9PEZI|nr:hypothetical protein O1611_g10415 [Lasiodiplodia mahajangana]